MIVAGLTGSIGMGKSTAVRLLRQMGIAVHDSDAAVHRLLKGEAAEAVLDAFPEAEKDGHVDRAILGSIVFGNATHRKTLEAILHPLVIASQHDFLKNQRCRGAGLAVLDIPLLYETGAERRVDAVIVVTAPYHIQKKRVLRRGLSEEAFRQRLALQTPDADKRRRADFVVQTGLGLRYTRNRLKTVIGILNGRQS